MNAAGCGVLLLRVVLGAAAGGPQQPAERPDTVRLVIEWSEERDRLDSVSLYATVLGRRAGMPEVILDRTVTGTRDSVDYVVLPEDAAAGLRFALSARAYVAGHRGPRAVVEWTYPLLGLGGPVRPDATVPGRYAIRLALERPQFGPGAEPRGNPGAPGATPAQDRPPPDQEAAAGRRPDSCRNEPPGFFTISDQQWQDGIPEQGRKDRAGWVVQGGRGRLRVVSDADAPAVAGRIVEGTFPRGMPGGRGPFRMDRPFDRPVAAVYMCLWHKLDPAFTNNGNSGTKFGFLLTPYQGGAAGLNHYFNLTNRLGVNLQSAGGRLNRNMFAKYDMMANRGRWHLLEFLVVGNSSDADGVARIWVDGQEVLNQRNVRFFFPGQPPLFSGVTWNPTYGGGLNPVPRDLYQRIGRWYISGRR